jgi:glutathione S-transferase
MMKLVGMLDSPYVRRVAVSLQLLGLPFEHQSLSVFRTYEAFRLINPVVKAPTLVCDDGTVLMDSTLILDHAESLVEPERRRMPAQPMARRAALRSIGLALAACEKSVQLVYERNVRPPEKLHEPWVARVRQQMQAALAELEVDWGRLPHTATTGAIDAAGITVAVVWRFIEQVTPHDFDVQSCPNLSAWSTAAEALPAFRAAAHGAGTVAPP